MSEAVNVVDVAVFYNAQVVLVRRGRDPDAGKWALPGGRIEPGEDVLHAARRELREETSIDAGILPMRAVGMFEGGRPEVTTRLFVFHFPRAISRNDLYVHGYLAPKNTNEVRSVRWAPLDELHALDLAFNHRDLIVHALAHYVSVGPQRENNDPDPPCLAIRVREGVYASVTRCGGRMRRTFDGMYSSGRACDMCFRRST